MAQADEVNLKPERNRTRGKGKQSVGERVDVGKERERASEKLGVLSCLDDDGMRRRSAR